MSSEIDIINDYVQTIRYDNNYWMVRTMGGDYYKEFINDHYIAIGHNDILLREINGLTGDIKFRISQLKEIVKRRHPEVERPGHIASQLMRFCAEISIGDIVLIPGYNSSLIGICEVIGSPFEDPSVRDDNGRCPFMKRLPVRLLKQTTRADLSPKAQFMFNSRHPISDINDYAMYLDNTCLDYYQKNDETHVVLRIKTMESVSVDTFYNIEKIFDLAEAFSREIGLEGNANEVSMKVQMESPGFLHFISKNKNYLAVIGLLILFINGGGINNTNGQFHLNISTPGLIQSCSDFLDRQQDRAVKESIRRSLDSLKIETPEDFQKAMIEMLKVQNEKRNDY